mmetsp:Transcript_9278/g.23410  ORF Transcript_9278/g.23410 Transcript_9278/m.23410 type:complete len:152 (-) Transcript_9278:56-511(-)
MNSVTWTGIGQALDPPRRGSTARREQVCSEPRRQTCFSPTTVPVSLRRCNQFFMINMILTTTLMTPPIHGRSFGIVLKSYKRNNSYACSEIDCVLEHNNLSVLVKNEQYHQLYSIISRWIKRCCLVSECETLYDVTPFHYYSFSSDSSNTT